MDSTGGSFVLEQQPGSSMSCPAAVFKISTSYYCSFELCVLPLSGAAVPASMGSVLVSVHRGVCAVEQKIRAIDGPLVDVDANGDVDCGGAHDGFNFGKVFRGLFFIHVLADHEEFITSHAESVVPVRVVD